MSLVLAYCSPKKQTVLQTDASIKGLGACLLQEEKPVYFASKVLIEGQKGYVAIEIESLAVVLVMEKFLETDHKLLEVIISKSLNQATPRIQWILIMSFAYHFTVRYNPGVTNQFADYFSWLGGQKDTIKVPKLHIHQITNQLHARGDSLQDIRLAAQEDDELALLKHTITTGWPSTIREVPSKIQPYWTFKEELTVVDCIVLRGTRIVIQHKKHQATLNLIHGRTIVSEQM